MQYDRAIEDLDRAIQLAPQRAYAYGARGWSWRAKHEYDKAIADFDTAIRLDSKDADPYNGRGLAWRSKGAYDRALADLDQAVRVDPEHAWAYNNRGCVWRDLKEYAKAIADFDQAIRLDAREGQFPYGRAVLLFMAHRGGVVDAVKEVLRLNKWRGDLPIYAVLLGHFAALRAGQGNQAKAFLDDAAQQCDTSAWPYPVVKYLRGEIDELTLLSAAIDNDKMTEARGFLGLDALQRRRVEAAVAHFHWVKENGNPLFNQFAMSVAELDRLDREQAAGDGP